MFKMSVNLKCKLFLGIKHYQIHSVFIHRITSKFPPIHNDSLSPHKDESLSVAHRLMLSNGIIASQDNGLFTILPMGMRAIEKICKIIDSQLQRGNCQKLSLPALTSASLWKKSGRLEENKGELLQLHDRHDHKYILSPTHEEVITNLVSNFNIDYSNLPVRLYQISAKFRDEKRMKHGLLRGKEFLMKDLYTFDKNLEQATTTYEEIIAIYTEIFKYLGVPVRMVEASVGNIGGEKSHEFHVLSSIGEDNLMTCAQCDYASNSEIVASSHCPRCNGVLSLVKGIEVAHAFLLGTRYSLPLSGFYKTSDRKRQLLEMGCYGIGVTRLLAASLEVSSCDNQLVWPLGLSPYKVCLIPPKKGSKEAKGAHWAEHLERVITQIPGYEDDVIIDDRSKLTIGLRLSQAKNFGYPVIIIIGKSSLADVPQFEVIESKTRDTLNLTQAEVIDFLTKLS